MFEISLITKLIKDQLVTSHWRWNHRQGLINPVVTGINLPKVTKKDSTLGGPIEYYLESNPEPPHYESSNLTTMLSRPIKLTIIHLTVKIDWLIYVRVHTMTAIWTVSHRLKSTPTNGHRFTALRRSPIQILTGLDVTKLQWPSHRASIGRHRVHYMLNSNSTSCFWYIIYLDDLNRSDSYYYNLNYSSQSSTPPYRQTRIVGACAL